MLIYFHVEEELAVKIRIIRLKFVFFILHASYTEICLSVNSKFPNLYMSFLNR